MGSHRQRKAEFGDFQTPPRLARQVVEAVHQRWGAPSTVLEPTCGVGNFLLAAHQQWGTRAQLIGLEISGDHLAQAGARLREAGRAGGARLIHQDFFTVDWAELLRDVQAPVLVVGNPPWVTSAGLGALGGDNLPPKSNLERHKGLDAVTGRSNFDISEWMATRLLEVLCARPARIALLIKVAVARKLLLHAWKRGLPLEDPRIVRIDARTHFAAAVDACLFTCSTERAGPRRCPVYLNLERSEPDSAIGLEGDVLLADSAAHVQTQSLLAEPSEEWRSGVKHDAANILELRLDQTGYRNGFGQAVDVESSALFPLLKSSHVARGVLDSGRHLLITQRETGEDTSALAESAPQAFRYLSQHSSALASRRSRIYRDRPPFSIFGVGPYTFAPFKVAISGLYKKLAFMVVPPQGGKPVLFDDTVYFTPCWSAQEAHLKHELLCSERARLFFSAYVFWDAKRPVTSSLLGRLSLSKLADELGQGARYRACMASRVTTRFGPAGNGISAAE